MAIENIRKLGPYQFCRFDGNAGADVGAADFDGGVIPAAGIVYQKDGGAYKVAEVNHVYKAADGEIYQVHFSGRELRLRQLDLANRQWVDPSCYNDVANNWDNLPNQSDFPDDLNTETGVIKQAICKARVEHPQRFSDALWRCLFASLPHAAIGEPDSLGAEVTPLADAKVFIDRLMAFPSFAGVTELVTYGDILGVIRDYLKLHNDTDVPLPASMDAFPWNQVARASTDCNDEAAYEAAKEAVARLPGEIETLNRQIEQAGQNAHALQLLTAEKATKEQELEQSTELVERYETASEHCLNQAEREQASTLIKRFFALIVNQDVRKNALSQADQGQVSGAFTDPSAERTELEEILTALNANHKIADFLRYHFAAMLDKDELKDLTNFRQWQDKLSASLGLAPANRNQSQDNPEQPVPPPAPDRQETEESPPENIEEEPEQNYIECDFTQAKLNTKHGEVSAKEVLKSELENVLIQQYNTKTTLNWVGNSLKFRGKDETVMGHKHDQRSQWSRKTEDKVTLTKTGIRISFGGGVNPASCDAIAKLIRHAQDQGLCGPVRVKGKTEAVRNALRAACEKMGVEMMAGEPKSKPAPQPNPFGNFGR